ncbi:MAG: phosphoribosyltransferase [Reyranellaceae bacterium]
MSFTSFANRKQAGEELARALLPRQYEQPLVLALPRGGVPVALEVARALKAPLDLLLVRKIGVPRQPELAAAAVVDGEAPDIVYNDTVLKATGLRQTDVEKLAQKELAEIDRRRKLYMKDRPPFSVAGRTAIVVDDGIATGTTVKAALKALKRRRPEKLVLAAPVAPADTLDRLRRHVDEVVCLHQPQPFGAIGYFYDDFHQVPDDEVIEQLERSRSFIAGTNSGS